MSFCVALVFESRYRQYPTTEPLYVTYLPHRSKVLPENLYRQLSDGTFVQLDVKRLQAVDTYDEACRTALDVLGSYDQYKYVAAALVMDEEHVAKHGICAPVVARIERDRSQALRCGTCGQKIGENK